MDDHWIGKLFELAQSRTTKCSLLISTYSNLVNLATVRNANGETLLHIAAGYGRVNLASYLISKGVDVNAQDKDGQAPLHNASCHGHFTTSMKLIEAGANVNLTDKQGWSPMHFALARSQNSEKISPIFWKVIELLLKSGADPYLKTNKGRACLSRVKSPDDRREIKIMHLLHLLEDVEEPNYSEMIINRCLKVKDFFELVKIGDENIELLKRVTTRRFLASKLEEFDGISPLHRAAGYNHLETARLFVERGASVDVCDNFGRIPLHNAAQYGHVEMIEFLISRRADINKQDYNGFTPLHVAASNRTFRACLKLIQLGSNINTKCHQGKLPYDLAESHDVREVLKPDTLRRLEVIPSSSGQGIYIHFEEAREQTETEMYASTIDNLMLNSDSDDRLFNNTNYSIKKVRLDESDWRYQLVMTKMKGTVVAHVADVGGFFTSYEILSIDLILNEKVWSKYRLMCRRLEIDGGHGSKNERLLFHGSNFIDNIQKLGFDERYAQRNGMFGAGIYFAKHSSKSNQYAFGWGQGCQEHMDKSCYVCERSMIYAQVALGKSLISKEAMPDCAHAPPGFHSVIGKPEVTVNLTYPEYVIYNGDQAYPLYVIRYRIKP